MADNKDKEVIKIWGTGNQNSSTLVIPKRFASRLGLLPSAYAVVEYAGDRLLIRKMEIPE